jgi:hypothetical protein
MGSDVRNEALGIQTGRNFSQELEGIEFRLQAAFRRITVTTSRRTRED